MIRSWIYYMMSLAIILVFHGYYTGWVSWLFLVLVLSLPLASLLFSLPAILTAHIEAQFPTERRRGEEAVLGLVNAKQRLLPTPLCRFQFLCEDKVAGCQQSTKVELAAWERTGLPLPTAHCGSYVCELARGKMYDYLGLFAFPVKLPKLGVFRVLPGEKEPQPLPNLGVFQTKSYRPKHGGGFSEIHDLRQYRPGDNLRDIHWKLSAKTDDLIVREAQEPNRGQTLLTLDFSGTRGQLDEKLDVLCWLSRWLLAHEVAHLVSWLEPRTLEPESAFVADEDSLRQLIQQLLDTTVRENTPSIRAKPFLKADWHYHIAASGEEGSSQ